MAAKMMEIYNSVNKNYESPGQRLNGALRKLAVGKTGSAMTIASTVAVRSVTGEVRAANNNVTDTPQLLSFSIAGGVMFYINKAPGIKPFKIGVLVGKDRVSNDDVVKFRDDRKSWISFQIGHNFTHSK